MLNERTAMFFFDDALCVCVCVCFLTKYVHLFGEKPFRRYFSLSGREPTVITTIVIEKWYAYRRQADRVHFQICDVKQTILID